MSDFWCEELIPKTPTYCEDFFVNKPISPKIISLSFCFWCNQEIPFGAETKDHLIPRCMGSDGKTVTCCYSCNQERGKVTEFYSQRSILIEQINKNPNKITSYKNRFLKRVASHFSIIAKWTLLHLEKDIRLPYDILEVISLDGLMPLILKSK